MSSVMITTMFGGDAWATTLLGTTNTIAATAMTDMRALVTPSPTARPLPYIADGGWAPSTIDGRAAVATSGQDPGSGRRPPRATA
jgi:hypothetical protein